MKSPHPGANDLLIVVDMQEDFVNGSLGTREAQKIVPDVVKFIQSFPGRKVYTKDTHTEAYLSTQEGKNLPVKHTIRGTAGWELVSGVRELVTDQDIIVEKGGFGSLTIADIVRKTHYENIYLIGVCTGICVISNAVIAKAADTESVIHIVKNLCACVSPECHETAVSAMRLLQMDIIE